MDKIKNLSLKKTIMLYLCIALTCSFFISAAVIAISEKVQYSIWYKYIDIDKYSEIQIFAEENYRVRLNIPRISSYNMSDKDNHIVETCDFLETWTSLILAILSSGLAVLFFYNNKLKKPIEILENSADRISKSRLDFHIKYALKDEMGRLCCSFEHMRKQLEENNLYLWKMIEEQKMLRAAIAHDIRAPLSVLKGYHEMLLEFIPQDKIEKEKLMEMLTASEGQVERLTTFVDTMKQLSSVEERSIKYEIINTNKFVKQLETTAVIWIGDKDIVLNMIIDPSVPCSFQADRAILMEVFENIFTNAIRYATNRIKISVSCLNLMLQINITDDGTGFIDEDTEVITKAYYHNNPADDLSHFGLGLYICKLFCEKHGGRILFTNDNDGGACVKASFHIQ